MPPETRYVTHDEFAQFREYIGSQFNAQTEAIKALGTKIDQQSDRTTPWGTLASWSAVVITIGVLVMVPVREDILQLRESISSHANTPGHRTAMELHSQYKERFETIRAELIGVEEQVDKNEADLEMVKATRFRDSDGAGVVERITRLEEQVRGLQND